MLRFAKQGDFGDDNVEEVNDYYPFGGLMSNTASNGFQPYKYNGKELDREAGLNLYDYGARFYDPAIGRWHVVDPMAEHFYGITSYRYCKNSPINRVDVDGNWDVTVHTHKNREHYGYGFLVVTDKKGNTIFEATVRVEGSNSKENGFNKRIRTRTYADTPTGIYRIKGWSNRLPNLNEQAYGPNAVLELDYISGEAAGLRNGIHLHGGRQQGKGGKGKATLSVTQGCLRIYDEDIKEMKSITDLLELNDPSEKGHTFKVIDDLERVDYGPYPRPFDYPKDDEEENKNKNNDIFGFLLRVLQENPDVKYYVY